MASGATWAVAIWGWGDHMGTWVMWGRGPYGDEGHVGSRAIWPGQVSGRQDDRHQLCVDVPVSA